MRRLRPTKRSRKVVADWSTSASEEHKRRMAELLRSLDGGYWDERWWWQQYSSEPEVYELRFDAHAHVFMRVWVDEDDGLEYADFISIEHSDAQVAEG